MEGVPRMSLGESKVCKLSEVSVKCLLIVVHLLFDTVSSFANFVH